MSRKALVLLGMTLGSFVGGYVPLIFGADLLSVSSIIGNAVGGLIGVWLAYKLTSGF